MDIDPPDGKPMSRSPFDRVQGLLQAPGTRTHVVGSRPAWARALALVVLTAAAMGGTVQAGETHAHQGTYEAIGSTSQDAVDQGAEHSEVDDFDPTTHVVEARAVQARMAPEMLPGLIRVGLDENGILDRDRLFSAWKAGGLGVDDGMLFLQKVWTSGAYIDGAGIENDGDRSKLIDELFEELGGSVEAAVAGAPAADWDQVERIWDQMIKAEGLAEYTRTDTGASVDQAQRAIEQAVNTAGIASLRLPLSALANPDRMIAYAAAIEAINRDLASVSGWEGQVMGLAGRVSYELGVNYDMIATDHGGMAGLDTREGGVFIMTSVKYIGHEWAHGVRYSVGDDNRTQMENQMHVPGSERACFHQLVEHLGQSAPGWVENMEQVEQADKNSYITSPDEMMARSFEMQVEIHRERLALGLPTGTGSVEYKVSYPDIEQARAQAEQWQSWFAQIGPHALTRAVDDMSQATAGSLVAQADDAWAHEQPEQGLSASKLEDWRAGKISGVHPQATAQAQARRKRGM